MSSQGKWFFLYYVHAKSINDQILNSHSGLFSSIFQDYLKKAAKSEANSCL